jgi:hypothetical protein
MMKTYRSLYLAAFSATIIAAGTIYLAADILDVPVKILTRDPYRAAKVPPYFAYFSLLGSTVWLIAGTATLMTGIISRKILRCRLSDVSSYRIIVLGGIIGLVMALDDILLFHDAFADALGIPEILFHLFYFIFIASMIIYSRDVFRLTPWIILFIALACFGLSSVIDFWPSPPKVLNQSEDVFKFCAIVLWAFYFLHVSWAFVKGRSS